MKVLCADDSKIMRKMVGTAVERLGHEYLEAADGQEALRQLAANRDGLGLILLDWNMPEPQGLEVLKTIKGCDLYRHIPVMMVTAEGEAERKAMAFEAGAAEYVTKPFAPQDLEEKIQQVLVTT